MARPTNRKPGAPRFAVGERVIWKSGNTWKRGTILSFGKNREEAEQNLPIGYKVAYNNKNTSKQKIAKFLYYVAADSPLFKPGFTTHCVPERHLQSYKDSWFGKEEILWENYRNADLFELALEVGKQIHLNKASVPEAIKKCFYKLCPHV